MIKICNYYGMADDDGRCVGHPIKAISEYTHMLRQLETIELIASPCIIRGINQEAYIAVKELPHDILISGTSFGKRIIDKIKILENMSIMLQEDGILFVSQVDFFFFLFLFFYKKKSNQKIYILIYHQNFVGGLLEPLLQVIYRVALQKMDGVIYTQKEIEIKHERTLWIPDYSYYKDNEKLLGYKKKQAVCLGTMNRYKRIEELIEMWKEIDVPLVIAGRFDDEERFNRIKDNLPKNILIKNEVLDVQEYNMLLHESMYSILPYDMNQYKSRTSGVLLESVYAETIVIAPEQLLIQNAIPGVGYLDICDIKIPSNEDYNKIRTQYKEICVEYSADRTSQRLKEFFIN